mgnify:CR=1 FL=1
MDYKDKVVLVTGGANGIGKAIAMVYKQEGAKLIIADKDQDAGEKLTEKDPNLYYCPVDLADSQNISQLFTWAQDRQLVLDILINNAGLSKFKPLLELEEEEWDEILSVNLKAMFRCSQEFYRLMQNAHYGRIINIASTRALMSEPNSEAYAASKGGIVALTHALALSMAESGITVNAISPGWIQNTRYEELTEKAHKQHPSQRVGKPEDIARACLWLTDEHNDFVNGENIVIDGGMTRKMIYTA